MSRKPWYEIERWLAESVMRRVHCVVPYLEPEQHMSGWADLEALRAPGLTELVRDVASGPFLSLLDRVLPRREGTLVCVGRATGLIARTARDMGLSSTLIYCVDYVENGEFRPVVDGYGAQVPQSNREYTIIADSIISGRTLNQLVALPEFDPGRCTKIGTILSWLGSEHHRETPGDPYLMIEYLRDKKLEVLYHAQNWGYELHRPNECGEYYPEEGLSCPRYTRCSEASAKCQSMANPSKTCRCFARPPEEDRIPAHQRE